MLVGEEGVCPVCNKSFSRKTTLLNHIRNHSAEKKYVCNYCQKGKLSTQHRTPILNSV
jgi:uncharacterized Zn-finger protein